MPHILIIEDEEFIRENIVETLELNGFEVSEADGGASGIDILRLQTPDMVICDLMMPDVDGYDVLAVARTELGLSNIPFIILTAKVDKVSREKALSFGADAFITKPFAYDELLNTINRLFNQTSIR